MCSPAKSCHNTTLSLLVMVQAFRVVASRGSAASQRHNPETNPPEGPAVMRVKVRAAIQPLFG